MTAQTGSAGALEQARAHVGAPCGPLRVGRDQHPAVQEAAVFGALGFVGALAFYGLQRAIAEKTKGAIGALR